MPEIQQALENLGLVKNGMAVEERLTTETQPFEEQQLFKEGKIVQIFVNKYERNQQARNKCIQLKGSRCFGCDIKLEEIYGDIAKEYIHIHHIKPLSEIKEQYDIDPANDLIPLCPNCHAIIHLNNPAMTIEELKSRMKKAVN